MPNTHSETLIFGVESGQELTRSLVSPFPLSPGVIPCCCGFMCFWKAREWTRLGISFCTTTVFHKSRGEHFLPLACVPTPCLCTHAEAEPGTVPLRNSGFRDRWTADLGNAEKPEYKLMCQVPKSFSTHFPVWSLDIIQIQSLDLVRALSSELCAWHVPGHPPRAFSNSTGHMDRSTMRGLYCSACCGFTTEYLFAHFGGFKENPTVELNCADAQSTSDPRWASCTCGTSTRPMESNLPPLYLSLGRNTSNPWSLLLTLSPLLLSVSRKQDVTLLYKQ